MTVKAYLVTLMTYGRFWIFLVGISTRCRQVHLKVFINIGLKKYVGDQPDASRVVWF